MPSTLLYIRFKLGKEHTTDMEQMLRMVEEHARILVHKWIGDASYERTFGSEDLPRHLFYKYVSHQTPLRLSTSFGFSTTTLMFLRMDKTIWAANLGWVRIAACTRSVVRKTPGSDSS